MAGVSRRTTFFTGRQKRRTENGADTLLSHTPWLKRLRSLAEAGPLGSGLTELVNKLLSTCIERVEPIVGHLDL